MRFSRGVVFSAALAVFLLCAVGVSASPLFPQCPAVGVNTGCQFLIQINADGTVSVLQDTAPPNNGPYDGVEDTLVGVQNNSTNVVTSLPLTSTATIFGFDGDGPCTQSPRPAICPASGRFPGDPTGYGGPGVSFSGINSAKTSGVVNFANGIAPGGSAWFGLEERLTASQITPGPPSGTPGPQLVGVPEPITFLLLGTGLSVLGIGRLYRRRM